jgi:hypothetical protein
MDVETSNATPARVMRDLEMPQQMSPQTGLRAKTKYLKLKSSVFPCAINGRRRTALFLVEL